MWRNVGENISGNEEIVKIFIFYSTGFRGICQEDKEAASSIKLAIIAWS